MLQALVLYPLALVLLYLPGHLVALETDPRSPYYQHLPDCSKGGYKTVTKKTNVKGIVCPMIKDEIGFLSEWTAYYEMQGFDHIIFFDNNSTTSLSELDPWIKSGFVTIEREWWVHEHGLFRNKKNKFNDMMRVKMLSELMCKRRAVEWGYEVFVSLDLDEYLMPTRNDVTVMDELADLFNKTTRGVVVLPKLQFPPVPHFLEPVNLLTIEAYQSRMNEPGKMNYYTSIAGKVALRLQGGPEYSNATTEYVVHCCDFHGCRNFRYYSGCMALFRAGGKDPLRSSHVPTLLLPYRWSSDDLQSSGSSTASTGSGWSRRIFTVSARVVTLLDAARGVATQRVWRCVCAARILLQATRRLLHAVLLMLNSTSLPLYHMY
jgi:hypothetical protein